MNSLYKCIKSLGFKNGWKYWRACRSAEKDPEFVLRWADQCEKSAENESDQTIKKALLTWAKTLRLCYEEYDENS
jgi:hypothetical protein